MEAVLPAAVQAPVFHVKRLNRCVLRSRFAEPVVHRASGVPELLLKNLNDKAKAVRRTLLGLLVDICISHSRNTASVTIRSRRADARNVQTTGASAARRLAHIKLLLEFLRVLHRQRVRGAARCTLRIAAREEVVVIPSEFFEFDVLVIVQHTLVLRSPSAGQWGVHIVFTHRFETRRTDTETCTVRAVAGRVLAPY